MGIVQIKYAVVIQYGRGPEILMSLLLDGVPFVLPVDQILRNAYLDARFIGRVAIVQAAPAQDKRVGVDMPLPV